MASFQWPRRWLMTDPRLGPNIAAIVARLPGGTGVALRNPDHPEAEAIAASCAERALVLAVARDTKRAKALGATLVHNPAGETDMAFSLAVHDDRQARDARGRGAALAFVSPVYPTRSHPDAAALGQEKAARLAALVGCPAIALGGMNDERFARLSGFHGWAGIDAWLSV